MRVVISQPMYFPWVGFLEQLRLADVFVLYDDVQFSKGSFTNRVQIKTPAGSSWLTVPLRGLHLGQRIKEVQVDESRDWRKQHRERLAQAYHKAHYAREMLALVDSVFAHSGKTLSQIAYTSTMALADYFGLTRGLRVYNIAELDVPGKGSQRVLDIVRVVGGTEYITGHGARNYLDHAAFEKAGIAVRYMQYRCLPYPQLHGDFTPYVTALDLVANCGAEGKYYIQSETVDWRKFADESH